jgi:hypothetical protein
VTDAIPQAEPDHLLMAAVVGLAHDFDLEGADRTQFPVLAPVVKRQTELNELDRAIEANIEALVAVCRRPHDRLGVSHELVRADQARRVPVEGLVRLSTRTEEWYGLASDGQVMPKRLLTARYHEEFDFFENRMAAQLVDRLRRYLAARERDLNALREHVSGLERYARTLGEEQSHWKRRRLAVLLGEAAADGTNRAGMISEVLERIRESQRITGALRGSPLYRKVNRRALIPFRLPRTNLLTRDKKYRQTASLWDTWSSRDAIAETDHQETRSAFPDAYRQFATAVTGRALEVLGLASALVDGHGPVLLSGTGPDGRRWTVEHSGDHVLLIRSGTAVLVRLVVIPLDLAVEPSAAQHTVQAVVDQVTEPMLVVYPGAKADRERLPPAARRLVHWSGLPRPGLPLAGVVPISPLEIESTERLARALRWAYWSPYLSESYPQRVRRPDWWRPHPREGIIAEANELLLLRPLTDAEHRGIAAEIATADAVRIRRRGEHGGAAPQETVAALRSAEEVLHRLATCPMCRRADAVRFNARDRNTFHCSCECKGQWGLRLCGSCNERFPVLWANGSTPSPVEDGDRIDSTFGSEIVSLPCPDSPDWSAFVCPRCGTCQNSPRCNCARGGSSGQE